jgi:signal transduction histidine kinase
LPDVSVPLALLPQPALVSDAERRICAANAPALALLGDNLIGKDLSDALPGFSPGADVSPALIVHHGAVAETGRVLIRCLPLDDRLLLLLEDATEEEKKASADALRAAEERLQMVIGNVPVIVFGLDSDGSFTFLDGRGLIALRVSPARVVGRSIFDVFAPLPQVLDLLCRSLTGELHSWTAEVAGVLYETHVNPLKGGNGEPLGLIGVAMDVTERSRLQRRVVRQEKLAALGRLIAGIAHETNNPLAAISGTAQLLESHPDDTVRTDASAIRRMAERASRVVRSMLTFARGSEDDARLRQTLRSVVEEVLALSEYGLRKADVQVELRFAPEGAEPVVWVNPSQIGQVVLNLLNNAEFALRNAPCEERYVCIETDVEGNWALLRVSDNGEGIPPSIQPRIFDPFFTTKEPGEGTGLGLSICHGIATSHKGSLEVESPPGGGSVFTLRLPVMQENRGRVSKTTPGDR